MTERRKGHRWQPIADLPEALRVAGFPELDGLLGVFAKRRQDLAASAAIREYTARLVRSWSIETGILENLYTLGDSVTLTLVEQGFDEALLSHGDSNLPAGQLVAILRDHQEAAEGLFSFVKGGRVLGSSYIKELHRALTRHQSTFDALDPFGNWVKVPLRHGDWKSMPNNPGDPGTGEVWHQYCPPEQVDSEMERLVAVHQQHSDAHPVVEAAWLHHGFTQIHPFQDGNGRVARALASLVCIRGGGFPVTVNRTEKGEYVRALEDADAGNLMPLITMFERQQRLAVLRGVAMADSVLAAPTSLAAVIEDAKKRLESSPESVPGAAGKRASELAAAAHARLDDVATGLRSAFGGKVQASAALRQSEDALPLVIPVLGVSMRMGHPANVDSAMVSVELRVTNGAPARLVIAFLPMGRLATDLMAAVAFFVGRSDPKRSDGGAPVEPIYDVPFTFTGDREPGELGTAFRPWLEAAITRGLDIWRRSL